MLVVPAEYEIASGDDEEGQRMSKRGVNSMMPKSLMMKCFKVKKNSASIS